MSPETARAFARVLRTADELDAAGIRAAMEAGGFDPDTVEPDCPHVWKAMWISNARTQDPSYLTWAELSAMVDAREALLDGRPF